MTRERNPGTSQGAHASSGDMETAATKHQAVARSFEHFYRNHRDTLVRVLALSLGSVELASEAADEAMARAYSRWKTIGEYRNPAGWTYRVGLNWARSWLRRRRHEVTGVYVDSPTEPVTGREPGLEQALQSLPLEFRSVIVLRYYADWSLDDIAHALDIPQGTVKSRLNRALSRLNIQLGDQT